MNKEHREAMAHRQGFDYDSSMPRSSRKRKIFPSDSEAEAARKP